MTTTQKNILITGGAGFIGKNLIKNLIQYTPNKINYIIVFDNFISSNKSDFLNFINEFDSTLISKIVYFDCDITIQSNISTILSVLQDFYDVCTLHEIYHLASIASPIFYKKYPLETLDVGYIGTKNILNIAKQYNSKLLFSSTSEIYGDAQISPQSESYYGNVNCFGERSCYDESKRIAESLCYSYIKNFNLDIKIARIFNTYGPYMRIDDGRIITEVISSLLNSAPLTIYGNGTQTRSYCFVDDTVKQLILLMDSNCNTPTNIGNNFEITVNDTSNIILDVLNQMNDTNDTIILTHIPLTQNDPLKRKPCLLKNLMIFNNFEYTSFIDGIKQTIDYFYAEKINASSIFVKSE